MGTADRQQRITTAEVWRQARDLHPAGTPLVRVIDLDSGLQAFQPIPEGVHFIVDGATVMRPSLPIDHSPKEWQDVLAVYDAKYLEVTA